LIFVARNRSFHTFVKEIMILLKVSKNFAKYRLK